MKRLLWQARLLAEKPGWWLLTLMAAAFALGFSLLVLLPAQQDLEQARSRNAQLAARQLSSQQAAAGPSTADTLVRSLPSYRSLPQTLSSMFAIARELDVILDVGDYRYLHTPGESYGRYQIELPLVADYPTIRVLVARLMNQMPYAALDDISLVREAADSDLVEARIRLTLFLTEQ